MNAFIIIMFGIIIVLSIIIIISIFEINKRINTIDDRLELQNDRNKKLQECLSDTVCHINSIYKKLGDINGHLSNMNNTINEIHLKCGNITNDITKYVHADNDNRNKEIINCLANTSNDLRTLISNVSKQVLDFKKIYTTDINDRDSITDNLRILLNNIYQTVHGNTIDIKEVVKLIGSLDLTKISSAFEKLQNAVNYTDEQKETPTELKTVTKSKSAKSGKPASKKKTPLL